jgi:hypothetical protein
VVGAESFHPNPLGFELITNNFINTVGKIGAAEVCSNGDNVCSNITQPPEPSSYWGEYIETSNALFGCNE